MSAWGCVRSKTRLRSSGRSAAWAWENATLMRQSLEGSNLVEAIDMLGSQGEGQIADGRSGGGEESRGQHDLD